MSGANLSDADLTRATLSRANLSGANLSDANLSDATMPGFAASPVASLVDAAERTKEWLSGGHWIKSCWIKTPNGAYNGDCLACLHGGRRLRRCPIRPGTVQQTPRSWLRRIMERQTRTHRRRSLCRPRPRYRNDAMTNKPIRLTQVKRYGIQQTNKTYQCL